MLGIDTPGIDRRSLRFLGLFVAGMVSLGVLFECLPVLFQQLYMSPVAHLSTSLLQAMSVDAVLDTGHLGDGFCELAVSRILYRITFDCTGIFAILAFTSLTLAYPATVRQRASGLAVGLPAIFVFSVLRITVLGLIANLEPAWIELFHVYVMELATLGFMLFTWMYWLGQVRRA
ncbi:MAG: exosortase/archaeosortase family protein [bacterium]|nr:exosortase/archaeosortase family protein [bacterium]